MACTTSGLFESSSRRYRTIASETIDGTALPSALSQVLHQLVTCETLIPGRTRRCFTHAYGSSNAWDTKRRHSGASALNAIPGNQAGNAFTESYEHKGAAYKHYVGRLQLTKRKRGTDGGYFGRGYTEQDVCCPSHGSQESLRPFYVESECHFHNYGRSKPNDSLSVSNSSWRRISPDMKKTYVLKLAA